MHIDYLSDHPELIPALADWYTTEWEPYYGKNGPGNAVADLRARCNRNRLPLGLLAMDDRTLAATASLGFDVATGLVPSVIGLLVAESHRGRGIAAALIDACRTEAARLGHNQLFLSTSVLGPMLIRRGWRLTGSAKFLNREEGGVYSCDL